MKIRSVAYNPSTAPGMGVMMPGMQPGMYPEMQGLQMEMQQGMYGVQGGYQHHEFDPCCPIPCPPCQESIMQHHCPMPIPAPTPTPTPAHEVYVVKKGDTVYKIATRYGTTMQAIILGNNLSNPDLIYPGQILIIPGV